MEKARTGRLARLALVSLTLAATPVVAQDADPTLLPQASRQLPDFQQYTTYNVPSQPSGYSYNDPETNVKVVKITSPTFPVSNTRGYHDYSEAGPYISAEWGSGMHTILFRVAASSNAWLLDYQRGTGALSNLRAAPYPMPGNNAWSFSNVDGSERIAYIVHDHDNNGTSTLVKYDTATMQPVTSVSLTGISGQAKWLQVSADDAKIVFSAGNSVYAYDSNLTQLGSKTPAGVLDEPALDRGGRFVLLRRGGNGNEDPNCSTTYALLETYWYRWDLNNITAPLVCDGDPDFPLAHAGWVQGLIAAHNSNIQRSPNFYYNAAADTYTETDDYAEANFLLGNHYAAQWIQATTGTSQWYFGSNVEEGEVNATGWELNPGSSTVYRTTGLDPTPAYQKPQIGIRAVYQSAGTANPRRFEYTLAAAPSVTAMTAGTFYYDATATRLYVWPVGGGSPAGKVKLAAPGPTHNGIGIRRVDGSEHRLLAHTYSWPNDADRYPIATVSPDGKLAMFDSTMGMDITSGNERTDVFIVEIPTGSSGGGGDPEGGDVVWINDQGLQKNGNTIVETCGCGTARAESQQALASGDGFLEFVAGSDHGMFAIGIGDGAPSSDPNDIEFSLRFYGPNGSGVRYVEVRENGVYRTDTTYTEGTRFRIEIVDDDVNYFKYAGTTPTLLRAVESPPELQYPAKVEAVLMAAATSVEDAIIGGSGSSGGGGDIAWTNLSNATASSNTITENGGGAGNSGGQSTQTLSGDGFMEFTAVETDKMRAVGLDSSNSSNTYNDIEFAIVLGQTGIAEVRQNGSYITDTTYTANTRFRIAIENGVIKYYKYVGTSLTAIPATNTTVSSFPVHVDAALYGAGSTISDVTLVPQ